MPAKEPNKYMPPKVRRPREELKQAADQVTMMGHIVAGSYRREKPQVGDLDILIPSAVDFGEAVEQYQMLFQYEPIRSGSMKSEGIASYQASPLLINLWRIPEPKATGALLLFATGPYDLNIMMRAKAQGKGWKLSQYGLFDDKDVQKDIGEGDFKVIESDLFNLLGLQFITPVERESWRDHLLAQPKKDYKVVHVPSSNGTDVYAVEIENGEAVECECVGFGYRHKCRHLALAEKMFREGVT